MLRERESAPPGRRKTGADAATTAARDMQLVLSVAQQAKDRGDNSEQYNKQLLLGRLPCGLQAQQIRRAERLIAPSRQNRQSTTSLFMQLQR